MPHFETLITSLRSCEYEAEQAGLKSLNTGAGDYSWWTEFEDTCREAANVLEKLEPMLSGVPTYDDVEGWFREHWQKVNGKPWPEDTDVRPDTREFIERIATEFQRVGLREVSHA